MRPDTDQSPRFCRCLRVSRALSTSFIERSIQYSSHSKNVGKTFSERARVPYPAANVPTGAPVAELFHSAEQTQDLWVVHREFPSGVWIEPLLRPPLRFTPPSYGRLSGKDPCWRSDSNGHCAGFRPAASTDWATPAWCHGSDSNGHCAGFEAAASYQLGYRGIGAGGWIRTSTVHLLKVTPPASWATRANGGRWRDRTSAPLRVRRPSMPVPYLSANRPKVAEAAGVEPAKPCGTRGFQDRPPRQWGLRFHGVYGCVWCPSLDSNQQPPRSERGTSTSWATGAVWGLGWTSAR